MKPPAITGILQDALPPERVASALEEYRAIHSASIEARRQHNAAMVNHFYDLVTDFYEFGWGQSFHFAPMFRGESFAAAIARHEHWLAAQLCLRPGMRVLDVGCGVGGPMRAIARFSGATIVGVNNNAYQIARGSEYTRAACLDRLCSFEKANFMTLPMADETFDAIYAIEATCHAPDRRQLFSELARVLKPGGHFAGYEWCTTAAYRPDHPQHQRITAAIEEGDALPTIAAIPDVLDALAGAGLELIESRDLALDADPETPWYRPLTGRYSIDGFKHTPAGRACTHLMVTALELLRVAPKGSRATSALLQSAARALVAGGETGIFTPMFFFHVSKPARSPARSSAK